MMESDLIRRLEMSLEAMADYAEAGYPKIIDDKAMLTIFEADLKRARDALERADAFFSE